jgi:hypothetical protein
MCYYNIIKKENVSDITPWRVISKDLQDYVEWKFSLKRKYGRLVSATAKRVASPTQDTAQHVVDTLGSV